MINKKFLIVITTLSIGAILSGCSNDVDVKNISELGAEEDNMASLVSDEIDISSKNFEEKAKEIFAKRGFTSQDAFDIVKEKFPKLLSKNPEFYILDECETDENGQKYFEGSLDKRFIKVYENGKVYDAIGEWKGDN